MENKGFFTEVRVDATINKGNYESEKVGVTYAMAEGEDVFKAISLCKDVVYGRNTTDVKVEVVEKKEDKKEVSITKPKASKAAVKAEEPKVEETKVEETKVEEPVAEVAPKAEEPKKEKRTIVKAKNTPYDRMNESHKRLLSSFLDKAQPNWKMKGIIEKAAKASQELTDSKEDFLDGDGVIMESFKTKFLAYFA